MESDALFLGKFENLKLALGGDNVPHPPTLDCRMIAMAELARQRAHPAEFMDNTTSAHASFVRTMRINVNVESVRRYADCRAMTIGDQLNALRERSKMSLHEVAVRMGYRNASSIQRYFNSAYDPPALPNHLAKKLLKVLDGKGSPPIRREEILAVCDLPSKPHSDLDFAASIAIAVSRIWSAGPLPEEDAQRMKEIVHKIDALRVQQPGLDQGQVEAAMRALLLQGNDHTPAP